MNINDIEITRSDVLYIREFGDPLQLSLTIVGVSGNDLITLDANNLNHRKDIERVREQLWEWGFMR